MAARAFGVRTVPLSPKAVYALYAGRGDEDCHVARISENVLKALPPSSSPAEADLV